MSNTIKSWFLEKLAEIFGLAKTYAKALLPILEGDASSLLQQILPIALTIVESLATSSISGAMKQQNAFSQIQSAAKTAGISAGASAINLAIELAVANLSAIKVSK